MGSGGAISPGGSRGLCLHAVLGQGPFPVAGASGPGQEGQELGVPQATTLAEPSQESQPLSAHLRSRVRRGPRLLPPLPPLTKPQINYSSNTKTFSYCSFAPR